MVEHIPVVPVDDLEGPHALDAIDRACREWGFFQVTGHGIGDDLCARLFDVSREFFAQPLEAKRRIRRDADNPWGYFDQELTKRRQDWKEIFDFGPADGDRQQPRWPDGELRVRFESTLREYFGRCEVLALRLLRAIAANLGVPFDAIARGFDGAHTSFLRLNHYPPHRPLASGAASAPRAAGEPAGEPLGVGEHTDAGALTVLLQDGRPGLEVCRDGRWHGVQPLAGALVVNIGDMVQVWSNDRYRAALHRVVTHPERDRYSVPFFLNPSYETSYQPLTAGARDGEPALYRPIRWREFRQLRAAGDYADLGEEIQISHFRR